jgi:hypothetical protein
MGWPMHFSKRHFRAMRFHTSGQWRASEKRISPGSREFGFALQTKCCAARLPIRLNFSSCMFVTNHKQELVTKFTLSVPKERLRIPEYSPDVSFRAQ